MPTRRSENLDTDSNQRSLLLTSSTEDDASSTDQSSVLDHNEDLVEYCQGITIEQMMSKFNELSESCLDSIADYVIDVEKKLEKPRYVDWKKERMAERKAKSESKKSQPRKEIPVRERGNISAPAVGEPDDCPVIVLDLNKLNDKCSGKPMTACSTMTLSTMSQSHRDQPPPRPTKDLKHSPSPTGNDWGLEKNFWSQKRKQKDSFEPSKLASFSLTKSFDPILPTSDSTVVSQVAKMTADGMDKYAYNGSLLPDENFDRYHSTDDIRDGIDLNGENGVKTSGMTDRYTSKWHKSSDEKPMISAIDEIKKISDHGHRDKSLNQIDRNKRDDIPVDSSAVKKRFNKPKFRMRPKLGGIKKFVPVALE